jgi:hypothetical protein
MHSCRDAETLFVKTGKAIGQVPETFDFDNNFGWFIKIVPELTGRG